MAGTPSSEQILHQLLETTQLALSQHKTQLDGASSRSEYDKLKKKKIPKLNP
jgi:hypothetical protein